MENTRVDELQHLVLVLENSRYVPGPAIVCGRVFAGDPPGNSSSPSPQNKKGQRGSSISRCCIPLLDSRYYPMIPTHRLLQHSCRITLFTRANCSLCTKAKETLSTVWDARPFIFREVDVIAPGEKGWRDLYEFDTPVVRRLFQPWVRELIIEQVQ